MRTFFFSKCRSLYQYYYLWFATVVVERQLHCDLHNFARVVLINYHFSKPIGMGSHENEGVDERRNKSIFADASDHLWLLVVPYKKAWLRRPRLHYRTYDLKYSWARSIFNRFCIDLPNRNALEFQAIYFLIIN